MWDVWIHILGIGAECACWGADGPMCRPYDGGVVRPGGAFGRPRPTKGAAGGWGHPPLRRSFLGGNGGRTMCAPTGEGAGTCPSSAPVCVPGHLSLSPLPLRDIIPTPFGLWPFPPDRGNRPLDKGSRPPGGRLRKNKKGQVFDLSLKTQRRNAVSQKVLLVPFLSRKGTAYFLFQRK